MRERIDQWYAIRETIGLSCSLTSEGVSYALCRVRREKDTVEIVDRKTFDNTEELIRYLKLNKQVPIAVHIQGKGVLIKAMPLSSEIGPEHIIPVFPNYKEEDYALHYFAGQTQGWLALAKIDMLANLLVPLHAENLFVLRVFIGPFVAENILDQLNGYSGYFSFDGHHIQRSVEEEQWETYRYAADEKARFSVKVQGLDIAEKFVVPYASAFSLLMHRFTEELQVSYPAVDSAFDDYLQRKKFNVNGILLLAILFVLLLLNTVFYTIYQTKYEVLHAQTQTNVSNVSELQKLAGKVTANDSLLLVLGWNGGLHKSWLLNQLALSLTGHTGIDWQSLTINPVANKRFGTTVAETDNRWQIHLTGSCQTLNELEAWVRNLSQLYWLRTVEISRFTDQNKPTSSRKDFVINMQYRYDF